MRGRREEALELFQAAGTAQVTNPHWTSALLHNGLADYPAALTAARAATEHGDLFLTGAAADELRAAGQRVRRRSAPAYEKLTMQQMAATRLVASGATSHEVATQLFISKRTVDAHPRTIFTKLDVTSRRQLKDHPDLLGQDR